MRKRKLPFLLYNKRMRKIFASALVLLLGMYLPVYAEETTEEETEETVETVEEPVYAIDVSAPAAVLIDRDSGSVLFDKNSSTRMDQASLNKVMAVYLAASTLNGSQDITMSSEAFQTYDHSSGVLWIQEGETLSAKDAMYATMLQSANDTCAMLAEATAINPDDFLARMNAMAAELNMADTNYDNIFGYHSEGNYSTAMDSAVLVREALKNNVFAEIFSAPSYTISPTNMQSQQRVLANDCQLIRDGGYKYPDAVGGKIGSTRQSGYVLAAYAERNGTKLIAVVLSEDSGDSAYRDITKIFNWGFENYQTVTITKEEIGTKTVEVYQDRKHSADVIFSTDSSFSVLLPTSIDASLLTAEIITSNEDSSDPEQITAKVVFKLDGETIGTDDMDRKIEAYDISFEAVELPLIKQVLDYASIAVLVFVLLFRGIRNFFGALEPPE